MFIHLGENCTIRKKDIIAVYDIENTSVSKITRDFLNKAGRNGSVVYINSELPKSFVVTEKNGKKTVYISSLSTATLTKRFKESYYMTTLQEQHTERNET